MGTQRVLVDVPAGSTPFAVEAPDVSKLPGARVVSTDGLEHGGQKTRIGCVRAPSDRFVPGIEGVLFERATALALKAAGEAPSGLARTRGTSDAEGGLYTEGHEGAAGDRRIVVGHLLSFVGDERDALLCTAVCSEPASDKTCAASVGTLRLVGPHPPPPTPGLVARGAFFAADHPTLSLSLAAVVTGMVVARLLSNRPKRP